MVEMNEQTARVNTHHLFKKLRSSILQTPRRASTIYSRGYLNMRLTFSSGVLRAASLYRAITYQFMAVVIAVFPAYCEVKVPPSPSGSPAFPRAGVI